MGRRDGEHAGQPLPPRLPCHWKSIKKNDGSSGRQLQLELCRWCLTSRVGVSSLPVEALYREFCGDVDTDIDEVPTDHLTWRRVSTGLGMGNTKAAAMEKILDEENRGAGRSRPLR